VPRSTGNQPLSVVNGAALQPQLWLSGALLLSGESEYFLNPSLSPEGKRFVFTRMPTGNQTHAFSSIWLGQVDGAVVRPLIAGASSPVWSPDGSRLAFEHEGDVWVEDLGSASGSWSVATNYQMPTTQVESLTPPAV